MVSALLCAALVSALAASANPARADTEADLAAARERVAELHSEANAAYQQVLKAEEDLAAVTAELHRLREELAVASAEVQRSRGAVGRVARATYMSGGVESSLFLLLSSDPAEFNAQYESLQRVAAATAHTLDLQREREARLAAAEQQIAAQQQLAAQLREDKAAALAAVQEKVAAAERLEAELEEQYAAELAAQHERERIESATAAAGALAAQQERQSGGAALLAPDSPDQRITSVLDFALAQVGKGYALGTSGPSQYDCSGLVMAAYAQAGVSLPHYTRYQAARTRPVSLAQARPGDLLFYFGLGADHVAIYLGDGRMVHAANPGRGVVVGYLSEQWYAQRLTGVGRVIG